MKCLCWKIYYSPPVPVSPGGVIEVGAGEDITYQDVIDVTCTEKHHGKRTGPAINNEIFSIYFRRQICWLGSPNYD